MTIAHRVEDRIEQALNAEGRGARHVALGLLICAGAAAATATIAVLRPQPVAPGAKPSRHPMVQAVWPAVFSVASLAVIRVWNAPASPGRTRALGLWGGLQGLNAIWMIWRPRDKRAQMAAAVSTAAMTAAYAHAASYIDEKAAGLAAPTAFAGLSAIIAKPANAH